MRKHVAQGREVRYCCEDESRWGLLTLLGKVITACGIKPMLKKQWLRDNCWLYGAVEPASGENCFYRFSHLEGTCFKVFIDKFSQAYRETLNRIQLDQAGAHTAYEIDWPENVVPIFQPSHSPELNPVERVWQELRGLFKEKTLAVLPSCKRCFSANSTI